jgi:hypothetical protein
MSLYWEVTEENPLGYFIRRDSDICDPFLEYIRIKFIREETNGPVYYHEKRRLEEGQKVSIKKECGDYYRVDIS